MVNRDWSELVRLYQRLGFIPEGTDLKPIEVALEKALPDVLNADVSELNFKNVINALGDIMYTYPFVFIDRCWLRSSLRNKRNYCFEHISKKINMMSNDAAFHIDLVRKRL